VTPYSAKPAVDWAPINGIPLAFHEIGMRHPARALVPKSRFIHQLMVLTKALFLLGRES